MTDHKECSDNRHDDDFGLDSDNDEDYAPTITATMIGIAVITSIIMIIMNEVTMITLSVKIMIEIIIKIINIILMMIIIITMKVMMVLIETIAITIKYKFLIFFFAPFMSVRK